MTRKANDKVEILIRNAKRKSSLAALETYISALKNSIIDYHNSIDEVMLESLNEEIEYNEFVLGELKQRRK